MTRDYSRVDVDVVARFHDEYDLPALIRANLERYAALELKARGYEEWERPGVFLHAHVFDNVDLGEPGAFARLYQLCDFLGRDNDGLALHNPFQYLRIRTNHIALCFSSCVLL